ncbi:YwqG family protein [Streptomyces sp. G-G2]|uniref:YwqG family protein n=1 Tax=Streptomyces sp. G-G2 TaxID=3046201 RepID=UPI0024BB335F|nr:YwqG family protein [Streptomyces sp. G-G2]MDJ0380546.1 YwqG family protein [Streptomyces sp. G-G2]
MTHGSTAAFRRLAHQHLPADAAERWVGLLRPGVRLEVGVGTGGAVGRLGGLPRLPAGVEWPVWEGHGPLSLVASVDCAALPADALDIAFPADGTLLFFYFDGRLDDGDDALVLAADPDSRAGARVLHVPVGADPVEREAPPGLAPYPVAYLTARPTMTSTEPWHPHVQRTFAPQAAFGSRYDHPVCGQEFLDAVWDFDGDVGHQLGGHAHAIHNPVELEIADAALGGATSWDDPLIRDEVDRWVLLAQFDSENAADMMWGDCGALYWLIRPEDLAALRFDRALFTWQCG